MERRHQNLSGMIYRYIPIYCGGGTSFLYQPDTICHCAVSIKLWCVCSCKDLINADLLSKSDPFCVVSTRQSHDTDWIELFRTETIQVIKATVA